MLTRRSAVGLGIVAGAGRAHGAVPIMREIEVPRAAKEEIPREAPTLPSSHIQGRVKPPEHEPTFDDPKLVSKLKAKRTRLTVLDIGRYYDQAKKDCRILLDVGTVAADLTAVFSGVGDHATVDDLLDRTRRLSDTVMTTIGIRDSAIRQTVKTSLQNVKTVYDGTIDAAVLEQAADTMATLLRLGDARLRTDTAAFAGPDAYCLALAGQIASIGGSFRPPGPGGGSNLSLAYDKASATLTVTVGSHPLKLDVVAVSRDLARRLYKRLTPALLVRAAAIVVAPQFIPYIAICMICYDLVKAAEAES